MNPLCSDSPDHGEMQIEPMYGADGETVVQYGYFCQVKECNGYGGPVPKRATKTPKAPEPKKPVADIQQLTFLQEPTL